MSPKEVVNSLLMRHGPPLIIGLVSLGVLWGMTTGAVQQKADKTEVAEMMRDIRAIKALICKDHPGDSLCRVS